YKGTLRARPRGHDGWQRRESEPGRWLQRPRQERSKTTSPISTTVTKARAAAGERRINTWEEGRGCEVQVRDALGRGPSTSRRVSVERGVIQRRDELSGVRGRCIKLAY